MSYFLTMSATRLVPLPSNARLAPFNAAPCRHCFTDLAPTCSLFLNPSAQMLEKLVPRKLVEVVAMWEGVDSLWEKSVAHNVGP
jgi:hypothetical protein